MFTGVIKLAQIDDYISPSQNCIQPKIMKKDAQEQKATVSLNDCLACSGCITSAESILIEQMSIKKFIQNDKDVILIISPQSLLALSKFYKSSPDAFMEKFSNVFMSKFSTIKKIYSLQKGIQLCHQMIYQQYLQRRKNNQTVLCSECPGWICYAEKTLTSSVTQLMSNVKSPQQIMGAILRKLHGNQSMIVSIMPCYDKKLQAIRFQIQSNIKEVDLTLATTEIIDLISQYCPQFHVEDLEKKYCFDGIDGQEEISLLADQTSNGYIQHIVSQLGVEMCEKKQIRNSDFIQYSFINEGKQVKMAKCYGFRNIQKIVQAIKKKKCPYAYVEIMACPGGCFSGGGQPKYEDQKPKQVVTKLMKIGAKYEKDFNPVSEQVNSMMNKDRATVVYKPIQKTLNEVVMNW